MGKNITLIGGFKTYNFDAISRLYFLELLEQHNLLGTEEETTETTGTAADGEEDTEEWQGTDIFLGRSDLETFYEEVSATLNSFYLDMDWWK